jgi:hypothetical protein
MARRSLSSQDNLQPYPAGADAAFAPGALAEHARPPAVITLLEKVEPWIAVCAAQPTVPYLDLPSVSHGVCVVGGEVACASPLEICTGTLQDSSTEDLHEHASSKPA